MVAEILATDDERIKNVELFQGSAFSLVYCHHLDGKRLTKLRIEVYPEN